MDRDPIQPWFAAAPSSHGRWPEVAEPGLGSDGHSSSGGGRPPGPGQPWWGAALSPGLEELDLLGAEPRQELALHGVEHVAHARNRLPGDRVELRRCTELPILAAFFGDGSGKDRHEARRHGDALCSAPPAPHLPSPIAYPPPIIVRHDRRPAAVSASPSPRPAYTQRRLLNGNSGGAFLPSIPGHFSRASKVRRRERQDDPGAGSGPAPTYGCWGIERRPASRSYWQAGVAVT